VELEPASLAAPGDPILDARTSLRDALSAMLAAGAARCLVQNGDRPQGSLSVDRIAELLAP
jgi:hypothetical protein